MKYWHAKENFATIQRNVALSIFTPKPRTVPISHCHTVNTEVVIIQSLYLCPVFFFLYNKVCRKYFERPDIQVRGNNQVANSSLTVKLPINSTISVYDLWNVFVSLLGIQNKFIILKSNK